MTREQEEKVIRCLKIARTQDGGQTINILANVVSAYVNEVSSFLQKLKRQKKVIYFHRHKVWYWIDDIDITEYLVMINKS